MEDLPAEPLVSVILCTYSPEMYDHFEEAARSVLQQTYDPVELVVVVDGNETLGEQIAAEYSDEDRVIVHRNEENEGLSSSRNRGVDLARGEIVAFLDDDAVADPDWVVELVDAYERHDALAAGGKMTPMWIAGQPEFLPEEFYWLVGVTYRGFPEEATEVRNTFSSNLSFRSDVFDELGGFETHLGKRGTNDLQGGETELCARLRDRYGTGVRYNPDAVVAHKVFDFRTDPRWLVKRAFWQGYSKRMMQTETAGAIGQEVGFLRQLFGGSLPERLAELVRSPSLPRTRQLIWLMLLTGAVGTGYLYAVVSRPW